MGQVPVLVYTYAAPAPAPPVAYPGAPATIVTPDTATDVPSSSSSAGVSAVSFRVWVAVLGHPLAGFVYT
jgi:hypothetical protein